MPGSIISWRILSISNEAKDRTAEESRGHVSCGLDRVSGYLNDSCVYV